MGQIQIMCKHGDITVEWDAESPKSVRKAKDEFEQLAKAGYEFFVPAEGAKPKRIKSFDPALGRILASVGVKKPADKKKGTRPKAMAGGPNTQAGGVRVYVGGTGPGEYRGL